MYTSAPPPAIAGADCHGPRLRHHDGADGNPTDPGAAQQLVTDAVFEFLMPPILRLHEYWIWLRYQLVQMGNRDL